MEWPIFFILSAVCLAGTLLWAAAGRRAGHKNSSPFDPIKILFAGVTLSAVLLFIPIYLHVLRTDGCGLPEAILISVHNTIRLFVVDGEFSFITDNLANIPGWLYRAYTVLFAVLFVLAPTLTFGFVLSFFKNIAAYQRYVLHYRDDVYIFSELNEPSLALAQSLAENRPKGRFFVFADVYDNERTGELAEEAKKLGAVCFKKEITAIDFTFHSKKRALNLFVIGEDSSENIDQALKVIEKLLYREHANLYVFSTQPEAEALLANAFPGETDPGAGKGLAPQIRVRRINEVQVLISRTLYEDGFEKIFQSAWTAGDGTRRIHAAVIGMGRYGTEMTKALSWFCQMDGYQAEIDVFDADTAAEDKFCSLCPELMTFSGRTDTSGDARYTIRIHAGVDADTGTFDRMIAALPHVTYVFVALGQDEKNIAVAMKLRTLLARRGCEPPIQAVVYQTEKKEALTGLTNFKQQPYAIDFIGDRKTCYSEAVILASDLEAEALKRHRRWGQENDFWRYDYNYRSSVASAIHRKMKILCGIPGAAKEPQARTEEERWAMRLLEHRRWNAYMRAEGYVYGGTVDKSGRNDLAKTHNCLVPFDELPLQEQIKDDD